MKRLKRVLPLVLIPMASAITLKLGQAWFGQSFRWWFLGLVLVAFAAAYVFFRRSMATLARDVEQLEPSARSEILNHLPREVASQQQRPLSTKANWI